MNYRTVVNQLSALAILLSVIMLLMSVSLLGIKSWLELEVDIAAVTALFVTGLTTLLIGVVCRMLTFRGGRFIGRREALLLVAASWIVGALIGAVPYWLWAQLRFTQGEAHPFLSFVDCYFESMSGFTTTGASVLANVEALPQSLLLWRSLTHWLGGLGIVVLFVAVLPGLGVGGKRLFQVESPGPAPEGLQPHIRETARWLWYIYVTLTVAEVLALWLLTPMNGFDAICHTFATLATGGFSSKNASVGAYHAAPSVDVIITLFMVLAGVNFGLYYRLCRRRFDVVVRDVELWVYLSVLAVGATIVCGTIWFAGEPIRITTGQSVEPSFLECLRQAVFKTASIQTTTGFCTVDYNVWPFLAKAVLVLLMFVGACSGSTGGGIKVIRLWIAFKVLLAEMEHAFRPHVVRPVRVGRATVDPEMRLGAVAYIIGIVILFVLGAIAVMLIEQLNPASDCDFTTAATASVATLCNIGPGLRGVGPTVHYGWLSAGSKVVLSLLMALGRLEVFAIVVLLRPRFWQRD